MTESIEELVATNRRIEEVLTSDVRDRLLAVPGVIHVAVGLKEVGGRATDELCVKTYVEHKRPLVELDHEPVPDTVSGVRTDVTEIPEFVFSADETKHRPLVGGIQITNGIKDIKDDLSGTQMGRGTLGCFATLRSTGKPVLLTNWHVAMANGARRGESIFQPVPESAPDKLEDDYPKRPKSSSNAVAKIVDFQITEQVDGAIARVNTCYSCCCNCGTDFRNDVRTLAVNGSDAIAGTGTAVAGQRVYKVGRATDRTVGKVVTTSFGPFKMKHEGTEYTFTGQIQIQGEGGPFAVRGDSGSVVVNDARQVVGLQFGAEPNGTTAVANHIKPVTDLLKIEIKGGEASLVGGRTADGDELLAALSTRLAASESGTGLYERIETHQAEIVTLVNHDRHVTVVWHRIQGPSWLAALMRSAREPDYRIPAEIAGVTRVDALTRLREVLTRYGSADLRADVDRYFDELLAVFTTHHTIDDLLDAWRTDVEVT